MIGDDLPVNSLSVPSSGDEGIGCSPRAADRKTQTTATVVSQMLDKLHNGESDYSLVIPEQPLHRSQQTRRISNVVMGCIAGISLLVGGIGIMNIMPANMLERTKEIGVRRAIDARRHQNTILDRGDHNQRARRIAGHRSGLRDCEASGLFRGLWSTIITPWSVAMAFGVSTAVGIVFGSYPAAQALRLSPIEALKYE
jgi:putative ABC transport system permease protein